jgi:Kef-type K+ transport system membrane component KefB
MDKSHSLNIFKFHFSSQINFLCINKAYFKTNVILLPDIFDQITLFILLAAVLGVVAKSLKQPLLIAYIACGILAGPFAPNLISDTTTLTLFSHLGITMLLFIVGFETSPHVIREVGKASLITGSV